MTLNLPCNECVTKECKKKISCKHVDKLLGTGKAWPKRRTYSVDFMKIVNPKEALNSFQVEVLDAIKNASMGRQNRLFSKLVLKEAINTLNDREKKVVRLFREKFKQREIAEKLGVSQQRADFLIKRILKKMENYGKGL